MKLNLSIANENLYGDYLNLDPLARPGTGKINCPLDKIDSHVSDAECSEIRIETDTLSYFPHSQTASLLAYWGRKLAHGGTLTISGTHVEAILRAFQARSIDVSTLNMVLLGTQHAPFAHKRAIVTLTRVLEILDSLGLQVIEKEIENNVFVVKAIRP